MRASQIARVGIGAGGGGGGGTEDVIINAVTAFTAYASSGTNTNAGVLAVLSDNSDSTYMLDFDDSVSVTCGFADLLGSENVASFEVIARCQRVAASVIAVDTFGGITPTPTSDSDAAPSSVADVFLGPFTKSGGGSWTPAQFNSLTLKVSMTSDGTDGDRLYRLRVRATKV